MTFQKRLLKESREVAMQVIGGRVVQAGGPASAESKAGTHKDITVTEKKE